MNNQNKLHYVAITGIIVKDGKYLICQRAGHEKAFPNRWTVPGGKLEAEDYTCRPKDTADCWYNVFDDLLRREVKEEVDLEIDNIKYLTHATYLGRDDTPSLVISLFADYKAGDVKLCNDLIDHAWITAKEIKNYDLIGGIDHEIADVDKILNT